MTCNSSLTSNIPVGAYEVKVTDHYGCQFTKQIQVGQNINDLAMEIMTVDEVCDGNDGSFKLEANNYTGALQFALVAWSGGTPIDLNHLYSPTITVQNNSFEIVGIPAGTYTVDISLPGSNNYCNRTEVVTINNEGIAINSTQISSAQGNANRGILFLDVVGAPMRDIEFNWVSSNTNNPYQSRTFGGLGADGFNELSELGAGTYTVTITYGDCEITQTFVIPFCALVANEFTRNDYCQLRVGVAGVKVFDNGLDVTGQANYQWAQVSPNYRPLSNTNNVVNNLEAGTYDVTVTYGGCSIVEQVVLLDFGLPISASKVDAYCGGDNGSANYDFSFLGGSFQSVSINWTNANNNQPLAPGVGTIFNYSGGGAPTITGTTGENLPVGSYFINVDLTSNAGRTCRRQILVKINPNPTLPSYTITTSPSLCGSSNGIVAVQGVNYPAGQVPTYTWTPLAPLTGGPYIGAEIKNLAPGDYQLDAIYPCLLYTSPSPRDRG